MGGKYEKGRKMTTFIVGVLDSSTYGNLAVDSIENIGVQLSIFSSLVQSFTLLIVKFVSCYSFSGTGPKKYLSVARISSGLNQQELETLHGHIGNNWIQFKGSDPENYGLFFGKDKPDTWVMPEKSCVVEVSFDPNLDVIM